MSVIDLKSLYETDDYEWLQSTIELLKNRQFNALDLENLIEELEDLGSEKRNAVVSLLNQIIRHLLLLDYWTSERERNINHWRSEIVNFRDQLDQRLTTNLRNYLQENLDFIYKRALLYVKEKTGYSVEFPDECPYTLEQLLDLNWFPDRPPHTD
ncbi:DUF29 domain-containing protein [Floridanema evergladense]|uniref:DUF29 domain-containing protein n=1 Tax=Floridaenema evergladense BLCC-F167 TaxID=3153639 RepID=A0ABV4WK06_9CYAN